VSQPFAVAGCDALGFTPALSAQITRQLDGAAPNATPYQAIALTATLSADPDQAGIKTASVLMPKPLTIDISKLGALCEQAQYLSDTCPEDTKIGTATAVTPLLPPGQVLTGPAYILRGDGTVLPRVFVRLHDPLQNRISISIVGKTSFENQTQIRTVFDDLPDAPLNSFSLTVGRLLSTTKSPCQDAVQSGGAMTGTLTGQNGKTNAVNSEFNFDCSGLYVSHVFKKRKGAKSTLKFTAENLGAQPKTKKLTLKFGKYLTLSKKKLAKKLTLTADGKKLKSKCFKFKSASTVEIGFCGKKVSKITLSFKAGSLIAAKKLRSPKVSVTNIAADNKKLVLPLSLKVNQPDPYLLYVAK